jgi:adenylylsulfate kinase-like enzyme
MGSSKLAAQVEKKLFALGLHTHLFDGDQLQAGLNHDLGADDQLEQVRRAAEVARVCTAAGLVVLVAMDAPSADSHRLARQVLAQEDLVEIGSPAMEPGGRQVWAPDIAFDETESPETAATRIVRKLYG